MIANIANDIFYQMKKCKTQIEMENIWFNFKQITDPKVFNEVENYLIKNKAYYFYITMDGISGCIKERILGEF